MVSQTKKENLFGQGIALSLDDNFQEFYNLGEKMEEGHAFGQIGSLDSLHNVGTYCKLTLTPQTINQNKRTLMTLEGQERIKISGEASEQEVLAYFEKCKEEKLKELKERIDIVEKLKENAQVTKDTTDIIKA